MNYIANISLLENIAKQLCCDYLSDLRYIRSYRRTQAAEYIDAQISAEDVSLNEWNDALSYLVHASAEKTQAEARQKLIEMLRKDQSHYRLLPIFNTVFKPRTEK